jgi:hypothetical protein
MLAESHRAQYGWGHSPKVSLDEPPLGPTRLYRRKRKAKG